jgi:hypothetical protein
MKISNIRILTLALCVAITGCASIVSKSDKLVTITSNPIGANFVVKKANGLSMTSGVTPATITLGASDGYFKPAKYVVEYTRKGVTQSVPLSATINGWYAGNILFGGLIGLLIVDPATGAMWKLNDTVIATFNQTTDITHGRKTLKIANLDQVPLALRGQLVAIR